MTLGDSTGGLHPAPERRTRGSEHLQSSRATSTVSDLFPPINDHRVCSSVVILVPSLPPFPPRHCYGNAAEEGPQLLCRRHFVAPSRMSQASPLALAELNSDDASVVMALALLLLSLCVAICCVWTHNRATLSAIYLNPAEFEMGPPPPDVSAPSETTAGTQMQSAPAQQDKASAIHWRAVSATDDQPARVHVGAGSPVRTNSDGPARRSPGDHGPRAADGPPSLRGNTSPPRSPVLARLTSLTGGFSQALPPPLPLRFGGSSDGGRGASCEATTAAGTAPYISSPLRGAHRGGTRGLSPGPLPGESTSEAAAAGVSLSGLAAAFAGAEEALTAASGSAAVSAPRPPLSRQRRRKP